jgi:NitT/TauT family transport system permease protein
MMSAIMNSARNGLHGMISMIVLMIIWEMVCRAGLVPPIILPAPSDVFVELFLEAGWYVMQAWHTLLITLAGFACAVAGGVLIAVALVSSRFFERYFYPLIIAFNSIPKVALAPLFVIWLGTGSEPKILIAFMIAVFAVIIDTVHGLRSVPPDLIDLGRVLKGSPLDFFLKVKLPSALPSIVAGLKVALSLALVGTIVGEFVSSQQGLGYIIMSAQGSFDTVRVFASLFILALMGMVLYGLLAWVERRIMAGRRPHE